MKRFLSLVLTATFVIGWLIPSSAEAGIGQRIFGRNCGGYVTPTAVAQSDSYRRYSYEPSMTESPRMYYDYRSSSSTNRTKPAWMYPKGDPRKYR